MAMKNPVHPGAIVREDCLKPLNLSVTEGAKRLGVGRQTLSNLVNEKVSVSIEMAYRAVEGVSARLRKPGLACSWPSTSLNRVSWKEQSRSNVSRPRNAPPSEKNYRRNSTGLTWTE